MECLVEAKEFYQKFEMELSNQRLWETEIQKKSISMEESNWICSFICTDNINFHHID